MSEIKVGEYVKTKDGNITKIKALVGEDPDYKNMKIYEVDIILDKYNDLGLYEEDIKSHSPNIIDLLEVGDYVNGYKVRGKTNEKVVVDYYCYSQELCDGQWLSFQKDLIKTIVTHEQFAEMEYKV